MRIIICVDNQMGMMFNCRRQSRDSALCEYLLEHFGKDKLYMTEYSAKLFEQKDLIEIKENIFEDCSLSNYFFIEDPSVFDGSTSGKLQLIDEIVMCLWNRDYPSDKKFNLDMSAFHLDSETEFAGKSHEKITVRVYRR